MSLEQINEALKIIETAVESTGTTITTPISNKKYIIHPLQAKHERIIKQNLNTLYKYTNALYNIFHDRCELKSGGDIESYDEFVKSNSLNDSFEFARGILESTYVTSEETEFVCEECEHKYTDKIKYKKLKLKSTKWDKDKPFNEYVVTYSKKLNKDIKITFKLSLPSMYDNLGVLNITAKNKELIDILQNFQLTSSIEALLMYVRSVIIEILKQSSDENTEPEIETIEFVNAHDIIKLIEKLPDHIVKEALEKISKEFDKYTPEYVYESKCPSCNHINEIQVPTLMELLRRIMG